MQIFLRFLERAVPEGGCLLPVFYYSAAEMAFGFASDDYRHYPPAGSPSG